MQESATLEYKASAAVDNAEAKKSEIAKDISAMANAEGGQFVYGMSEAIMIQIRQFMRDRTALRMRWVARR